MPMRPGIHISNDDGWDGNDDGDDRSPAEMSADIRAENEKARARREANARKPKSFGDPEFTASVYARFNAPKPKTLADGDND